MARTIAIIIIIRTLASVSVVKTNKLFCFVINVPWKEIFLWINWIWLYTVSKYFLSWLTSLNSAEQFGSLQAAGIMSSVSDLRLTSCRRVAGPGGSSFWVTSVYSRSFASSLGSSLQEAGKHHCDLSFFKQWIATLWLVLIWIFIA